jgi:phospholipid/cholesterol/gamma-HCH transport system ATP-binding protein
MADSDRVAVSCVAELADASWAVDGEDIVKAINLKGWAGEVLGIMGPSGSGKTTLLRLMAGLLRPTRGRAFLFGADITDMPEAKLNSLRRRTGFVFQHAALFDSMTVLENAAFPLLEHTKLSRREAARKAFEKLSLVGLEGVGDLLPAQLSGGMQKRVGIARALSLEPELILYDEPTGELDPIAAEAVENVIRDLQERMGVACVIVSHDVRAVLRLSETVAVLHEGQIVAVGSPDELARCDHRVVRAMLSRQAQAG